MKDFTMFLNQNKIAILYVDDEVNSLKYFAEMFEELAPIFTAESAAEGIRLFKENQDSIGIVVSDKRMPRTDGIEFLNQIRRIDDEPLRILVTAHSDLKQAVEALNDGLLYSYLTKPWSPEELEGRLKRAMDRFWIRRERNKLLKERAMAFHDLMMSEKASNIATLSSGLNHHMRNSINVIQAFFDMIPVQLEKELGESPKDDFFWSEYYDNVSEQIGNVLSILTSLEKGAGGAKGSSESLPNAEAGVDLERIINDACFSELEGTGIKYSVNKQAEVVPIVGVKKKLRQMAKYVVSESAKNIEEDGGEITIDLSPARFGTAGDRAIRIRVVDNGPIVAEDIRKHLFDPFFVRSDRPDEVGTDLLACYLITFQHGGTIKAELDEAGRNMIEIILPVAPSAPLDHDASMKIIDDKNG